MVAHQDRLTEGNAIGNPARFVRRRLLVLAGVRAKGGRAQSEVAPEDAFRTP